MPKLANNRREQFARARSKGMKLVECQKHAGYSPNTGSASALAKVPEVAARIRELKEMNEQSRYLKEQERRKILHEEGDPNEVTQRWVQIELYENLRLAREAGNLSAANKALDLLARSLNLFDQPYEGSISDLVTHENAKNAQVDIGSLIKTLNKIDGSKKIDESNHC